MSIAGQQSAHTFNDWSGGQFYILDLESRPDEAHLKAILVAATDVLNNHSEELNDNGRYVAMRLVSEIPAVLKALGQLRRFPKKPLMAKPGYVYLIQSPTNAYKIGRTVDPSNRLRTFSVKLPFEVDYACVIQTDDMHGLETELHQRFAEKRLKGEWFDLSPEDVEYIKGLAK